jgi:transposase-like protein
MLVARKPMVKPRSGWYFAFMTAHHESPSALADVLDIVRDAHFHRGTFCPRCSSPRTQRWGGFAGRQRYRCLGCKRTFSDLTATPAAYIMKLDRWAAYVRCLADSLSIRKSASLVGINATTAFRWRHRILQPLNRKRETASGWIEVDLIRLAYSEKGRHSRGFGRAGGPTERRHVNYAASQRVSVLLIHDRTGHLVPAIGSTRPGAAELQQMLQGHIDRRVVACARQGRLGAIATFARRLGGSYHDVRYDHRLRPGGRNRLVHIQRARRAVVALVDWMRRFHGVATKYLLNYLNWFVLLDRCFRQGFDAELLRWPMHAGHSRA